MTFIRNNRVDVYEGSMQQLSDGNEVPVAASKIASQLPCTLHQWHNDPDDTIQTIGVLQNVTAKVYFDLTTPDGVDMTTLIDDRFILIDELGIIWLIRGDPERHGRFPQTSYVSALLEKQTLSISGLPIENP